MPNERPPDPVAIDLGQEHYLSWVDKSGIPIDPEPCLACNGNQREESDRCTVCEGAGIQQPLGALVWHRSKQHDFGGWCGGCIWFAIAGRAAHQTWSVDHRWPLTTSPSLLCSCGDHGWIRDGRWVSA